MADKEVPKVRVVTFNEKSPAKKGELSPGNCESQCKCDGHHCPLEVTGFRPGPRKQHSKGGKDSPRTFFRLAGDQDK